MPSLLSAKLSAKRAKSASLSMAEVDRELAGLDLGRGRIGRVIYSKWALDVIPAAARGAADRLGALTLGQFERQRLVIYVVYFRNRLCSSEICTKELRKWTRSTPGDPPQATDCTQLLRNGGFANALVDYFSAISGACSATALAFSQLHKTNPSPRFP